MRGEEIRELLRRQPFEAFEIHLTDGRSLEVRHPDQMFLYRNSAYVGLLESTRGTYQRIEIVDLLHIVSVKPLAPAS